MFKLCLFRGCRIIFMMAVIGVVGLVGLFYTSFDVNFLQQRIESKLKQALKTENVSVSMVKLRWNAGPMVDIGQVHITADKFSIQQSHVQVGFPIYRFFLGSLAPEITVQGGALSLNLDGDSEQENAAIHASLVFKDVKLEWILNQEKQTFEHVNANIWPDATDITFKADGVDIYIAVDERKLPTFIRIDIDDYSGFPKSWFMYAQGLDKLSFNAYRQAGKSWSWNLETQATQGLVNVDKVHLQIPFTSFKAKGNMQLKDGDQLSLASFDADSLSWVDGENFADFKLNWSDGLLHVDALDGSTSMPMLWSWLWMLGDEGWHDWLNRMQHGRLKNLQASLDLVWLQPWREAPTHKNLINMKYHVTTEAYGADIALGLGGSYLYRVNANVEVDENHLQAKIKAADLNDGVGQVSGDYSIVWQTLMMNIDAKGLVDVGKLHMWLDPKSAKELRWQEAPATASVKMLWNASSMTPDKTIVSLKPTKKPWKLSPKGIPLIVKKGEAVWGFNRGLDLKDMQVETPWFAGDLKLFLDKNKGWALAGLSLDGYAQLRTLTDDFSLPITKPKGQSTFQVNYRNGIWKGYLDLSKNTWDSFAGFKKSEPKAFVIPFKGKPTTEALLPIKINHMDSRHDGFRFKSSFVIDSDRLDFRFKDIYTSVIQGGLRLLIPFDEKLPWGIESTTSFLNQSLFATYFVDIKNMLDTSTARPWQVFADTKTLVWDKNTAKDVHVQFSSNKQSVGSFSAAIVEAGDAHLENVSGSLTMLEHGKIDLHHLDADGSDQHITITGSVKPVGDGVLAWQGIAYMNGKFGTLMKQAELDQLFQEGDMDSLFLGEGKFKQGEPWWRGMKGSFRLRVDNGRIMEGGTLTHLLAAISLVDLPKYFVFQRSDVVGNGLLYDKLQIEAAFNGEHLDIKQLALKSSALDAGGTGQVNLKSGDIDILLIARPWQNIEAIVGSIPLLGYVLTGEDKSLLRKVYRIHGPASNADVDEMKPEDAGLPRSGLLESLFSLPGQWFGE